MSAQEASQQAKKGASVTTSWTRNFVLSGILVVCSVLAALILAEGIVRFVSPQAVCVPWQDELAGVMAPHPNIRGRFAIPDTFDTTISFSSQRFRGLREYSQIPASGVTRIATLGDSFTFGVGANDDETYPVRLQQRLIKRLSSTTWHGSIEVINASTAGSGTGDQALYFFNWVTRFQPQVVILNVHANDVDDDFARKLFVLDEKGNAAPRPQKDLVSADSRLRVIRRLANAVPLYSFLAQHSQLLQFIRSASTQAINKLRASAFQDRASRQVPANSEKESFARVGIPMLAGEIRWLNGKVRESGSRLVVTFLPPQRWVVKKPTEWQSDLIVSTLTSLSASDGIPFLDVTPFVRARQASLDRSLFYQGRDEHPNPMGYDVFAEIISEYLLSQRLVPLAEE